MEEDERRERKQKEREAKERGFEYVDDMEMYDEFIEKCERDD
jgi:hypothetical protein